MAGADPRPLLTALGMLQLNPSVPPQMDDPSMWIAAQRIGARQQAMRRAMREQGPSSVMQPPWAQ